MGRAVRRLPASASRIGALEGSTAAAERQAKACSCFVAACPRLASVWKDAEPAAVVMGLRVSVILVAAASVPACACAASASASAFGLAAAVTAGTQPVAK